MNERNRWAGALFLALATNAFLLIVILLQTSGLLFLYGTSSCEPGKNAVSQEVPSNCHQQISQSVTNENSKGKLVHSNNIHKDPPKMPTNDDSTRFDKQFVFFSNFQDVKSRNERLKMFQQEILDIVSGDTFVEKVIDTFVKRQNSGLDVFFSSSRPLKKLPRNFLNVVYQSSEAQINKQSTHVNDMFQHEKPKLTQSPAQDSQIKASSVAQEPVVDTGQFRKDSKLFNEKLNFSPDEIRSRKGYLVSGRKKRSTEVDVSLPQDDAPARRSDVSPEELYGLNSALDLEEVFSLLTDSEIERLPEEVKAIILPALIHFEGMIIRQLERLHATMVSHDLRLETMEKQHLNWLNNGWGYVGNGTNSNSTDDGMSDVIDEEFIPVNGTDLLSDASGSGEGEDDLVTTTPTPTTTTATLPTTPNQNLYDIYRTLAEVEQKVMALENYNVMSDSELIRTRNEVIKMDDRVTEMDRRHRNLQIRTAMQTYRVTELETFMGKTELALHTTLDAFSRMTQRLDSFKDRMTEYKSDIRTVQSQFGRQTQIMGELRSADSYKAHDINELRKSLLGVEERLNSLFRVMDQNVDTVRGDIRTMIERLCFNNNLSC